MPGLTASLAAFLAAATLATPPAPKSTGPPPRPAPASLQTSPLPQPPDAPIRVARVTGMSPEGPVAGWLARIDLDHPDLRLLTTAPAPAGSPGETRLQPVDDWAAANDAALAVNANFFGDIDGAFADVIGWHVSDGRTVSPPRSHAGRNDPALALHPHAAAHLCDAACDRPDPAAPHRGVTVAIAGVGPSDTAPALGTALLRDGRNHAATARVDPARRHPRTAAGLTRDAAELIVVVIDGRQPGHSVGVTLPELAAFLAAEGAVDAINLDGGGSSSFVADMTRLRIGMDRATDTDTDSARQGGPDADRWLTNRPSDRDDSDRPGRFRPVASHLGVRLETPATSRGRHE